MERKKRELEISEPSNRDWNFGEEEWNLACLRGLGSLHIFASSFICLSVESLLDWLFLQVDMAYFFFGGVFFSFCEKGGGPDALYKSW